MSGVRYGEKHQRQERQSEVSLQAESFGCRIYEEYWNEAEHRDSPAPYSVILIFLHIPDVEKARFRPARYVGCNQHVILLRPRTPWLHGMRA